MTLVAHCYDGQSSRMRTARLDCADGFLQLAFEGGESQRWPLEAVRIRPRLGNTPGGFRYPAPRLGEHTEEILAELMEPTV